MKAIILKSFVLLIVLFFASCDKSNDLSPSAECPEDALYTISNGSGKMVYLPCYNAWAVHLDESVHEDWGTVAASLSIDDSFKEDNLKVQINACLFEFDLPLLLADPAPIGYLYIMENMEIVAE